VSETVFWNNACSGKTMFLSSEPGALPTSHLKDNLRVRRLLPKAEAEDREVEEQRTGELERSALDTGILLKNEETWHKHHHLLSQFSKAAASHSAVSSWSGH
jgi:hypothetical protein